VLALLLVRTKPALLLRSAAGIRRARAARGDDHDAAREARAMTTEAALALADRVRSAYGEAPAAAGA
jgi:hypothetical protein